MFGEFEIKKEICEIGKRIYQNGMVAANDGNISVRVGDNEVLCTPTGVSKGYMTPEMICKVDMDGKVLHSSGKYRPSSEVKMHLRVYKQRPDVKSVVHAHPIYATSFAIAGIPLVQPIMPEAVISLGCVPIAPYGTPSTEEIPDAVEEYLANYNAVLLENHGALSWGDSLMGAYFKMEGLEFYAKLLAISKQLGGPNELPEHQVKRLIDLRENYGLTEVHPGMRCYDGNCSVEKPSAPAPQEPKQQQPSDADVQAVVREVTKRVLEQMK